MKLTDIDNVNHLIADLGEINSLIATAEGAEPATFQLLIEAPGDASFKMSAEGASRAHSRGTDVSAGFPRQPEDTGRLRVTGKAGDGPE